MDKAVKAGTGVIVVKDKRVLIGKRKGSHGEGMYAFPGGHIDGTDENLHEAGHREVFEETGIECVVYSPDNVRDELFTTYNILSEDGTKIYVTAYLIADYLSGGTWLDENTIQPLEPHKCEAWIWVTLEELEKLVVTDKQKSWIPFSKVHYYLDQMFEAEARRAGV